MVLSAHRTLNMLLHYLGKWKGFKFAANLQDSANEMHRFYMHPFQRILITNLLNILLNNRLFYVNGV